MSPLSVSPFQTPQTRGTGSQPLTLLLLACPVLFSRHRARLLNWSGLKQKVLFANENLWKQIQRKWARIITLRSKQLRNTGHWSKMWRTISLLVWLATHTYHHYGLVEKTDLKWTRTIVVARPLKVCRFNIFSLQLLICIYFNDVQWVYLYIFNCADTSTIIKLWKNKECKKILASTARRMAVYCHTAKTELALATH